MPSIGRVANASDADEPLRINGIRGSESKANCQVVADYFLNSFPTKFLIDKDGKLIGRFHPSDTDAIKKRIDELLGN